MAAATRRTAPSQDIPVGGQVAGAIGEGKRDARSYGHDESGDGARAPRLPRGGDQFDRAGSWAAEPWRRRRSTRWAPSLFSTMALPRTTATASNPRLGCDFLARAEVVRARHRGGQEVGRWLLGRIADWLADQRPRPRHRRSPQPVHGFLGAKDECNRDRMHRAVAAVDAEGRGKTGRIVSCRTYSLEPSGGLLAVLYRAGQPIGAGTRTGGRGDPRPEDSRRRGVAGGTAAGVGCPHCQTAGRTARRRHGPRRCRRAGSRNCKSNSQTCPPSGRKPRSPASATRAPTIFGAGCTTCRCRRRKPPPSNGARHPIMQSLEEKIVASEELAGMNLPPARK